MSKKTSRTDCHRPAVIAPADYMATVYYFFNPFIREDGSFCEGPGVGRARLILETRKVFQRDENTKTTLGKCDVCGANFKAGAMFYHLPTEEFITMGHDCASKYQIQADWSDIDLQAERHRIAKKAAATAIANRERKECFLTANPELRELVTYVETIQTTTFQGDGNVQNRVYLFRDIVGKFHRNGTLSPAQIDLLKTLYAHFTAPPKVYEEIKTPAPIGRQTFQGKVISIKVVESDFGFVTKIVMKITTPEGIWTAWGTLPGNLDADEVLGRMVQLTGTLTLGREPSFAFFKRPSKASIIKASVPA